MIKDVKAAFDFIQKLYDESSFLVKDIQVQLGNNNPRFEIIKPGGYQISARKSASLEPNNINLWLLRKFAVGFVEEDEQKSGQTITNFTPKLKVLYYRIILNDANLDSVPSILFGTFYDIVSKNQKYPTKFEHLMADIEYVDMKLFEKLSNVDFEHVNYKLKGKFKSVDLLSINSSKDLNNKVIKPSLKIYSQVP